MKRMLWALVLLVLVPVLVFIAWNQVKPLLIISGADKSLQKRIAVSDPSVVYILDKTRWTEFNIPNGANSVRVVTNATLPSYTRIDPTLNWSYVLQFEFLDSSDKILLQKDYAYRSGVRQFLDPDSGAKFSASFYLEPYLMPTDGHIVALNLVNLPQAARMRVKIRQTDPAIRDVAFRAYVEESIPDFRIAHRWLRLSDEQKDKLAKGNVYSQDLLAEAEIRNLLREQEKPLGPSGISGDSYNSRTLYVMREYEGQEIAIPVLPAGVYIDANIRAVIPLPEEGGTVRLDFASQGAGKAPVPGSPILVRWFGRTLSERSQREITWQGESTRLVADWKGGLLEVAASGGLTVRAFLGPDQTLAPEITPQSMYLRAYVAQPGYPVEFAVDHAGDDPTPFRLDIRQALAPGEVVEDNPVWLGYQLLDRQGKVVRDGSILVSRPLSLYERLQPDPLGMRMMDPASYYFSLPLGISAVRLTADRPALLTGYTRPFDLVRESRVPEDAYMADEAIDVQVSWFPLKPRNFQALVMNNRSQLLAVQSRPPQDNPDLLAGRYQWQDFHPLGAWLGRTLFTPAVEGGPQRDDTLPATYLPIATGREVPLLLHSPHGNNSMQADLAYFRRQSTPFEIRVYLDGRLHYQGRAAGTDGEIPLPPVQGGQHRLRVASTADAEFYLNHTTPQQGSLLKRLANRFEKGALNFNYEHGNSCEETLGMRLYTPQGDGNRSVLRVWLEAPRDRIVGPLSGWSFTSRRFDVRPETLAGSRVAAHRRNATDQGQAFFIPLAQDLPPGKYPLHAVLEQGPGGYLLLSRIVPGLAAERKVQFEQEIRHVQVHE